MSSETGEIYGAMARVMARVGVVGKTRKNPQQGYQFRGIDDVMAHCQDVMAAEGVICIPSVATIERETLATKSGGSMASVRLLVDHTFFAKDGSHVCARTLGEAMDSGDKASNKAMSAALKYALTEALMIPTYEADRDTEEQSPELAPRPAPGRAPAVSTTAVVATAKAAVKTRMKIVDEPSKATPMPPQGAPTSAIAVGFGTHRSKAVTALTAKELNESVDFAEAQLKAEPKAAWAPSLRAALDTLYDEQRFRAEAAEAVPS